MKGNRTMKILKALLIVLVMLSAYAGVSAMPNSATVHNLPPSLWYGVVWNRDTDTLHWINHVGEQASIARPKLPNEAGISTMFYISPNGRYMVIHGQLTNGRDGLGFYDLQAGAFIQTHESQAGEVIIATEHNPFTLNSQYVGVGLRNGNAWRVITFDVATGHSVAEITSAHPSLPQGYIPAGHMPVVSLYDVDEGLGQYRLHVRFLPYGFAEPNVQMMGFSWIPTLNLVQFNTIPANIHQFDMLGMTGQMLYAMRDPIMPDTTSSVYNTVFSHFDAPTPVFSQSNALAYAPKWVAGGLMVAFRVAQQPYAPMWHIAPAGGGQSIPFAPDYDYLYGTPDGFMIADVDAGHIKFSNTLQFEAFAPTVGNTVYSSNTSSFRVMYVTPIGANFSIASITENLPVVGVDNVVGVDIAPQPTNQPPQEPVVVAPPVLPTHTPQAPLVVAPPVIQPTQPPLVVAPPVIQPTQPPLVVAPPVIQPTQPPLVVAPPRTNIGDGDCSMAVNQVLSVGIVGHVQDLGGTLALRTNLHDELPSHQIPSNSYVNIVGGPTCHKGHRMWRINFPMNGQIVEGYVSEGVNNMRFIDLP
jgi:hypothetical protein